MLISEFVESIREDFKNLAELAGPETAAIVERIGAAVEPALQKHFLDAINSLVQEFNLNDPSPLNVTFEGDSVALSRLAEATAAPENPSPSDYSARIALRLSDDLKESIEHLATDVGSSVNSWIVRSLERTVRTDPSGSPFSTGKRQLRGKGRA
jgi:predicted HicB family RNase H-like nuclease